jgi:hypothetical protein
VGIDNEQHSESDLSKTRDDAEDAQKAGNVRAGSSETEPIQSGTEVLPKRQLGFARGQVKFKPGWERPMTDAEADAFLNGR